jgi:phytoene desaturase
MPAQKHIVIVGGGPGGLTTAMILAHRGFKVTLFEAQPAVGGRNAAIQSGPYVFDAGPTFLMLKDVLDEVFVEAGTTTDTLLDMRRLDPMYRLHFSDKSIDTSMDRERMKAEIARVFPGRENHYDEFMSREKVRFRKLYPCLQKSYHTLSSLFSGSLIKALPHMALGRSLFSEVVKVFGNEDLALSFTFQSKYLGMSPWECPGMFAMIPYIEHAFGIYHPIGGLSRISDCMADTAFRNGAVLHLSTPVAEIIVRNGVATGVRLASGDVVEADEVVINADFGYAATRLFAPGTLRKYTPRKMQNMKLSCSTFMMYLGLDRTYDTPHHEIVFARDYRANIGSIFNGKELSGDLSFYVRNASVTDPTLAPAGHSALYILVPVPNLRGAINWEERRSAYREMTLDAIESRTGMKLRNHIVTEKLVTPADWNQSYHVYEGATFNLAHNLGQMVYLRPRNKFEDVDHCYLVGGGTHPGSGLPTIYESGRISANLISRRHGVPYVSGNLEV